MEKLTKRRRRFTFDAIGLCKRCKAVGHVSSQDQQGSDPLGGLCRKCFRGVAR